jgi:hypothetical protein
VTYEALKLWIDLAQFILTGAIGVYMYLVRKNDATLARVAKLEQKADERLDQHAAAIAELKGASSARPTHGDMDRLRAEISGVKEAVASLQAENEGQTRLMKAMSANVDRMADWLVQRAK